MENKNPMREIKLYKVTLNIGVGEPGEKLQSIKKLLEGISGTKAVETITKKRIPEWEIRPGLAIGVKTTIMGKKADEILSRMLSAVENKLKASNFDKRGNFAFGVSEYVHIPGAKYDYTVGIVGISISVTLERRGFSISRKRLKRHIGKRHLITREEAMEFVRNKYRTEVLN
ncbi:50S ribosomal protein L5 [Candidatus Parvarchaeota archaeon]|jgi:large subunit ribosomal protein L5|nr:50S ribosomal protein L5 [Candidatus Parvarchaeota archaeon]